MKEQVSIFKTKPLSELFDETAIDEANENNTGATDEAPENISDESEVAADVADTPEENTFDTYDSSGAYDISDIVDEIMSDDDAKSESEQ